MADYTFHVYDEWEELVDNRTGKVIIDAYAIKLPDALAALGISCNVNLHYED